MRKVRLLVLAAQALLASAAITAAETLPIVAIDEFASKGDVTAGVSVQGPPDVNQPPACGHQYPCLTPRTVGDVGAVLSATWNAVDRIAVVGELSAYHDGWAEYDPRCVPTRATCVVPQTRAVGAALGGIKVRTPLIDGGTARGRFFFQALAGVQWPAVVGSEHVLQPGIGYDGYWRNGVGFRVELDYRVAHAPARDLSTSRVIAGILIPLGSE